MRKIIHIDMDMFFAAVEIRENPALRGLPIAVGGSPTKRGVISTCSYEARAFGVRSAMSSAQAMKLCPQLILLRHSSAKYREASEIVHSIFDRYTDTVQSLGCDEAYLDVTDSDLPYGSATLLAQRIRADILSETKLTASAGIAPNKLLAKLASEKNKPNGQFTVDPRSIQNFMRTLPLGKLHGIGKVTAARLKEDRLLTCSDVWPLSRFELVHRYGGLGDWLFDASRGLDEREVVTEWERKSLSTETTFPQDLFDPEEIRTQLSLLVQDLQEQLKDYTDRVVKGFQVKIKFHDFKQTTIERAGAPVCDAMAWELFQTRWAQEGSRALRLLGVGVRFEGQDLTEDPQLQFDAFLPDAVEA